LSRMFLIKGDWRKGEMKEKLWAIARELVSSTCDVLPASARAANGRAARGTHRSAFTRANKRLAARATQHSSPGDLNESLMELGATICTPASPDCRRCPIAAFCEAKKNGLQS